MPVGQRKMRRSGSRPDPGQHHRHTLWQSQPCSPERTVVHVIASRPRLVVAAATAAGLIGCSSTADDGSTTASPHASDQYSAHKLSESPTADQPLALVYNLHRPALDLDREQARRLVHDRRMTWGQLGQPGRAVLVRRGRGALRQAERNPAVVAVVPASQVRPTVEVARVDGVDPLRSPGRYPLTTRSRKPAPVVTTVTVVGDIMLGRRVGEAAAAAGDPGAPLRPMERRLAGADLTVGNLESTLSTAGAPRQGSDSFAADPTVLPALAHAGFDLLSLANNHTGDYGPRAFRQTMHRIDRTTIARVGAGVDSRAAWRSVVLRANGLRFGFVAFNAIGETPRATATHPGVAEVRMDPRTGPLNHGDLHRLTTTIQSLARRTDVVIALPHWGEQYTTVPVPDQRKVGAAMIDAGADLVVGGHPHWVQGIQMHRGHLIVNCLGNFIFDMDFSQQTEEGVVLELVFWGDDLLAARFQPYVIGPDFAPRPAYGPRARQTLHRMWRASDPPFSR
jgi:poly-gamma-glutamate capsule biosynthesis protein CapA/YwtB (metallophosphatase superfamily)